MKNGIFGGILIFSLLMQPSYALTEREWDALTPEMQNTTKDIILTLYKQMPWLKNYPDQSTWDAVDIFADHLKASYAPQYWFDPVTQQVVARAIEPEVLQRIQGQVQPQYTMSNRGEGWKTFGHFLMGTAQVLHNMNQTSIARQQLYQQQIQPYHYTNCNTDSVRSLDGSISMPTSINCVSH